MKNNYIYIYLFTIFSFYLAAVEAKTVELKTIKEFNSFINKKKPSLINITADWCGICKTIKPEFQEIANNKTFESIVFAEVNIDEVEKIVHQEKIVGVPTFIFVDKDGNKSRIIGVKNVKKFKEIMVKEINNKIIKKDAFQEDTTTENDYLEKEEKPKTGPFVFIKNIMSKIVLLIQSCINYIKSLFIK